MGARLVDKKQKHSIVNRLAGGAVIATVSCILAPIMLRTGLKTIRKYAGQFVLDPETGQIRRKDENVVFLERDEYEIEER